MNARKQMSDPKYPMKLESKDYNGTPSWAHFYKRRRPSLTSDVWQKGWNYYHITLQRTYSWLLLFTSGPKASIDHFTYTQALLYIFPFVICGACFFFLSGYLCLIFSLYTLTVIAISLDKRVNECVILNENLLKIL